MDFTEDVGDHGESSAHQLGDLLAVPTDAPRADSIQRLGELIDLADELANVEALRVAVTRGNQMLTDDLSPGDRVTVHYFLGNAWDGLSSHVTGPVGEWDEPERGQQIVHLREAVRLIDSHEATRGDAERINPVLRCQVYTNLANLVDECGRIVEALPLWKRAVDTEPRFAMAVANRGRGLMAYAELVHDPGHQVHLLRAADSALSEALVPEMARRMHPGAREYFVGCQRRLREAVPARVLAPPRAHAHHHRKGSSKSERAYRDWGLSNVLFLNDLNDLYMSDPIAARDVLSLPGITTELEAPQPAALGFFSQMKQEYATARYCLYQGTTMQRVHFSDRDVTLVDTLDYPAYGLAAEQVKIAFRLAYSLFDKIAYLLNDYLELNIPERRVTFRSLWFVRQEPGAGLRQEVSGPENRGLRALFWLAKDLYDRTPGFTDVLDPNAQDLADIRNHVEHKYLKLHLFGPPSSEAAQALAFSLDRGDFERRTLRLVQLARAALIYLSMGIYAEEHRRTSGAGARRHAFSSPVFTFQDRFKM
jgi:hypothetical protein